MKSYLVFRLYGPMASWGLPAIGEDRPTTAHPSRSAIVGLLGAALGIKREDENRLNALKQSVHIAIKQTVPGALIKDFHTSQTPSRDKKAVLNHRKDELSTKKLNTVLSHRYYRCDGLWIVAISLTETASFSLEQLQTALKQPVYTLCLGRKSCPMAVPLKPTLRSSCSLKEALDTAFPPLTSKNNAQTDNRWLNSNGWVTYFWQGDKEAFTPQETQTTNSILTTYPWDEPINRKHWQFEQRTMHQASVEVHMEEKA